MGDSFKSRFYQYLTSRRSSDSSNSSNKPHTPPTPPIHTSLQNRSRHPSLPSLRRPSTNKSLPVSTTDPVKPDAAVAVGGSEPVQPHAASGIAHRSPAQRLKDRLPILTLERATPPPASPPANCSGPVPLLPRRRSFRPPLLRASSRTSYAGRPCSPVSAVAIHEAPISSKSETHLAQSPPLDDTDTAASEIVTIMSRRKVWVKRTGASATLVLVQPDDLVDDVRDVILRKYTNSLGRSFDAPDVTLRIVPREGGPTTGHERVLGPEEPMCITIDSYYPGGQTVDEALIIDVPRPKTPKPSPRPMTAHQVHYLTDQRPLEDQDVGYFPPVAPTLINLRPPHNHAVTTGAIPRADVIPVPPLPSPGGERRIQARPQMQRQHTSSPISSAGTMPTSAYARSATRQSTRGQSGGHTPQQALPSPPASEAPNGLLAHGPQTTSPGSLSPRLPPPPKSKKNGRKSRTSGAHDQNERPPPLNLGLDGILFGDAVPPINILIVEDNIINLKLLEMFVKRLKVRWSSVMNGRDAVNKWREGGFHLVLMDIQLPIMSGLEATKEIRRLERVNGIGVFARSEGESRAPSPMKNGYSTSSGDGDGDGERHPEADDRLTGMFKSPVIIVALTASSLQSDRHEALAAGCNDFLTKPVNFPWFERKILEWGCMQALIDFDGWRQWKALNSAIEAKEAGKPKKKGKELSAEDKAAKEAKKAALLSRMGK